jgi:hypothetical protein
MTLTGSTVRQQAGIQAWKAQDPSVTEVIVDAPEGRFILSAKATSLGGGVWHYEYALQNLTNQRAGKSFTVPIPTGTTVSNVGFHDVDYHSGTPYEGTDWTPTIASTTVSWAMAVAANPANSNALRWGTLYNFRFDANVAPGAADVTIGLWRAGQPTTKTAHTVVPNPCLSAPDGTVCDDSNACTISDHCTGGVCAGTGPLLPDDVGNGVTVSQASGVTTISWTPAPNSASTSVLRGSVAQLPVGPGGDDEVCLDPNNAGSSTVDPENPPVDGGYWYLVRGVNACGVGTYGYEEDAGAQGPARQSTTCP